MEMAELILPIGPERQRHQVKNLLISIRNLLRIRHFMIVLIIVLKLKMKPLQNVI